ncbi:CBS domain-containing protein [Candidatus Uhrbacteria bacterium]|nr:CBS domain-containing protein [Candidatus Uhrbacteria bacterium]
MVVVSQETVGSLQGKGSVIGKAATVRADAPLRSVVEAVVANPASQKVYVVDGQGKYLGAILISTLMRQVANRFGVREAGVRSFMRYLSEMLGKDKAQDYLTKEMLTVRLETPLTKAIEVMVTHNVNSLPVVDDDNRVIGELSGMEFLRETLTAKWE